MNFDNHSQIKHRKQALLYDYNADYDYNTDVVTHIPYLTVF